MSKLKTLIVDDMPLAIASLKADLQDYFLKDVEIIGTANGVMEAAKAIKKLNPQLIFLDIQMGDGDGFDLLEMINQEKIAIIFTTGSKDFAIKAFQVSAIDYLLKPVDIKMLKLAIGKARDFLKSVTDSSTNVKDEFISLSTQEEIRVAKKTDIIRLEAMGNYTQFFLQDGSKILVTKTMKDFEEKLGDDFIRVHQSHLVNKSKIKSYIKTEGGYIEMINGTKVPVSVRKKTVVIHMLADTSL